MYPVSFFIAAGPCLIMALAALAMYILGNTLEKTRHASLWAVSFAIYTVGWAIAAGFRSGLGHPAVPPIVHLIMVAGIICYFAGFQERCGHLRIDRLIVIAAVVLLFDLAVMTVPPRSLVMLARRIFLPSLHAFLYGVAAVLVAPRHRETSVTERSVIMMLGAGAFSNIGLAALAVAQYARVLSTGVFEYVATMLATPTCAAMGLFTLMLIASDFSRERLRLIHTDPLTAVLNRAGFEQRVQRLIRRALSSRRAMALILTDIDRFKAINDRHGHLTGDAALMVFARCLVDAVPDSALIGRFGGEEFAILIDNEGASGATLHAERARALATQLMVPGGREIALTASFGVAERLPGESLLGLYARADAALYLSKQEGRNRTSVDPARSA